MPKLPHLIKNLQKINIRIYLFNLLKIFRKDFGKKNLLKYPKNDFQKYKKMKKKSLTLRKILTKERISNRPPRE